MEQIEVTMFDGGRNTKVSLIDCPVHQSPDEYNIAYDDYGAIKGRPGWQTVNSTPITAGASFILGFGVYRPSTMSAQLLAVANGTLHVLTGTATAAQSVTDSTNVYQAINAISEYVNIMQFKDLAILTESQVDPYKFNGTEFTKLGISAPTDTLTSSTNATGGNLTGTYNWVYTGVNSYSTEGDYGGITSDWAGVGENALVGSIPTAPASAGIESWNIYRNTAGASGVYWKVTNISNGVTSFTDEVADGSLVTAAPTDNGAPRKFQFTMSYLGRLWGAGDPDNPDYLWFSKVGEPYIFPSDNYIPISEGDGMDITGIAVQNGIITISKSNDIGKSAIHLLYVGDPTTSSDPENWFLTKAGSDYGSMAHRSKVGFENNLLLTNEQGFFSFRGNSVTLSPSETTKGQLVTESISFDIEPDIENQAFLSTYSAINKNNKLYIGERLAGTQFVYDYQTMAKGNRRGGAWSKWSRGINDSVSDLAVFENSIYGVAAGGSTPSGAYVYKLDSSAYNDGGNAIDTYYVTAPLYGKKGHEKLWKDFINCWIEVEGGGSYNMSFQYAADSATMSTAQNVALTTTLTNKKVEFNTSGYYLQLKFSMNTADQYFIIRKITYQYIPRSMRN